MNEINNLESTNKVINTEAKTIKQTSDKNSKQKEQITTNNNDRKTNRAKLIEYTEYSIKNKIYSKVKTDSFGKKIRKFFHIKLTKNKWILKYPTRRWCKNGCEGPYSQIKFQNRYGITIFCESCFSKKYLKQFQNLFIKQKRKYHCLYAKHLIISKIKIILAFFRVYNPWKEKELSKFEKNYGKCYLCDKKTWKYFFNHLKPNSKLLICLACHQKQKDIRLMQWIGIGSILIGLTVLIITISKLI